MEQKEQVSNSAQIAQNGMLYEGWRSVDKKMPEVGEYVLVNVGTDTVLKGRLMNNGWVAFFADGEKLVGEVRPVSHWMPLPEPPAFV